MVFFGLGPTVEPHPKKGATKFFFFLEKYLDFQAARNQGILSMPKLKLTSIVLF